MALSIPALTRCVLMGEEPLLIRCAEILEGAGHSVLAVISERSEIRAWAEDQEVAVLSPNSYESALTEMDVDLFVSAANLRIVPSRVLEAVGLAINFHDGPLPEYAGLNTPSWAILNGETEHGITWHVMEPSVDTGAILKKKTFPIGADVTARVLNVKCFDWGVRTFHDLVEELSGKGLTPSPQNESPRRYFGKNDGPPRGGFVSGEDTATSIAALVRATDHGPGENRFGTARLWVNGIPYTIGASDILDVSTEGVPGTVIDLRADGVVLQASPGRVLLRELKAPSGSAAQPTDWPKMHGIAKDDILHAPSGSVIESLDRQVSYWRAHLSSAPSPTVLPLSTAKSEKSVGNKKCYTYSFPDTVFENLQQARVSEEAAVIAAWGLVLNRYTGDRDLIFDFAHRLDDESSPLQVAPMRVQADLGLSVGEYIEAVSSSVDGHKTHAPKDSSFAWGWARRPNLPATATAVVVRANRQDSDDLPPTPVVLEIDTGTESDECRLLVDATICSAEAGTRLLGHVVRALTSLAEACAEAPDVPLEQIDVLPPDETEQLIRGWNGIDIDYDPAPIHVQFERRVAASPDAHALSLDDSTWTYADLNTRANHLAVALKQRGVTAGDRVGVCMPRSLDMVATLLAILKLGAAYVPLDPDYPDDRIEFMIEDAGLACIASTSEPGLSRISVDTQCPVVSVDLIVPGESSGGQETVEVDADAIAYVIYTSGSTGTPKGVMVTHRNVANFFAGMDERIVRHDDRPNVWLSVTSISFDISVLELFWTLSRGFEVVLQPGSRFQVDGSMSGGSGHINEDQESNRDGAPLPSQPIAPPVDRPVGFSLFYFSSDEKLDAPGAQVSQKYQMLLDGAAFADRHGFEAIWTPERHFHDFGGLYPNPSVISAAIAARTENVQIRAGSCVSPLHHPVRIAEDWSVVDNLSNGRVGISFAAGWQPNDFVIRPENFADRKAHMFEQIEEVRALWRGESRTYDGPTGDPVEVRTLPRPVQSDLPVWITAAGNPETFRMAGEGGYNVLTHLLGQTVDELAEKLAIYREAWSEAGHAGRGQVTLMLHAFVGDDEDEAKAAVRDPMKAYLRSSIGLIKKAAWSFPTFKQKTVDATGGFSLDGLTDQEMDAVLDHAFERYYRTSGLFGTIENCMVRVRQVVGAGVDEIGCLLDFGLDARQVLDHLPHLNELKQRVQKETDTQASTRSSRSMGDGQASHEPFRPSLQKAPSRGSVAENIRLHSITHLQCTPSQARMLLADSGTREALGQLDHMMIGGEAFPPNLARTLREIVPGRLTNMYGPTETTIWSSTWDVDEVAGSIAIGKPIANTSTYILDDLLRPVPMGVPGDLWIGGDGVTCGYLHRPELTASRFIDCPFGPGKMYKTGDVISYEENGTLQFHGRRDHQVKIRGHRVELGEIEAALETHPDVQAAAVIVREEEEGEQRLIAYVTPIGTVAPERLRDHVRGRLPAIMVPSVYVSLDKLPLTPNGKVDRNALPDPEAPRPSEAPYEPPEDTIERIVADIWQRALSIQRVGVRDNFFDLGGHSLLAVRVVREIGGRLGREVPIVDLFQYPTVRSLAAHLESESHDETHESGARRGLSRAEQRREALRRT